MLIRKFRNYIWVGIIVSWFTFSNYYGNIYFIGTIFQILTGAFLIFLNQQFAEDARAAYIRRSKQFPILWPPEWSDGPAWKLQRVLAVVIGFVLICTGLSDFINYF